MPSVGKSLGVTRLLKKWLRVQNSYSYKKGRVALVSSWHKAVKSMEIMLKNDVIHPCC
jgi:hypothetical protein